VSRVCCEGNCISDMIRRGVVGRQEGVVCDGVKAEMYNGRNVVRARRKWIRLSSAGSQNEIEGCRFEGAAKSKDHTGR